LFPNPNSLTKPLLIYSPSLFPNMILTGMLQTSLMMK
jgi:hypothetical protein